jgi:hypothetical protein
VAVSDDLAGVAVYVSGDTNIDGFLDLGETWIFTANYEVPSGLDPVVNIATAYGTSPLGAEVTAEATWSVDIIHPAIAVEKSCPDAAAPGETVTYTIWLKNTGDCELSVHVVDELLGIDRTITLAADVIVSADFEYIIPDDAPEHVENTVTATGTDAIRGEVGDQDSCKVLTMAARTIGYWKNHPGDWCYFGETSMFAGDGYADLDQYFPGLGAEVDGVNPLEMLRAQLIAAELNYMCFNHIFFYARYTAADITGTMRDAEEFLQLVYDAAGNKDLNTYWSNLSKQEQKNAKDEANSLKKTLEAFNAMGDEIFE